MKESAKQKKIETVIAEAAKLIGTPYAYGTYAKPKEKRTPKAVDCSSFIQYIFGKIGVALPRSSILQATKGKTIPDRKKILPGDLVFFEGAQGHYLHTAFKEKVYIGHVALYCGAGMIIHARSSKGGVVIEPLDEFIKNKYCGITRIQRVI